jgi:GH35 family endo-1,4-beta-xylanase
MGNVSDQASHIYRDTQAGTPLPPSASASGTLAPPKVPRSAPLLWLSACLLLALAQILWAGYQIGVGNQTIQIPFLKKLANPELYPTDAMVNQTLEAYPSLFFRALAWLAPDGKFEGVYLLLHLLTAFGVLAASYALTLAIFKSHAAAFVTVLLLLAGHHRALAGDTIYWAGFTHTWAAFPLAILALVFLYRDKLFWAFALTGLMFNIHALTAAHLGFMLAFWATFEIRQLGAKRLLGFFAVALVAALPTLLWMAMNRQSFGEDWLRLAHIRASQQLFLTSWWVAGNPDLPRFLLIAGLGALAMSFVPPEFQRRKTQLLVVAVFILFAAGYVFSELLPVPSVMRAQLFRVSRLFMILALAHLAFAIVCGWRQVFAARSSFARGLGVAEFAAATLVFASLALPPLLPLLPIAFVVTAVVAVANGRLSTAQAIVVGAAAMVCFAAWHTIQFPLAGTNEWTFQSTGVGAAPVFALALLGAVLMWAVSWSARPRAWALAGFVVTAGLVFGGQGELSSLLGARADAWVEMQRWARDNTPRDALFLTPPERGGFRIHSERSVVGEWRDGTQLFFSGAFASHWWERMQSVREGMVYDAEGKRQLSRGKSLPQRSDTELAELAKKLCATHIVLPAGGHRELPKIFENAEWAIYLPQLPTLEAPREVSDKDRWAAQERFMREVVQPNIEKHRKSDARVQIVDERGRPVYDCAYEIQLTRHAFQFSCSLPFFVYPEAPSHGDFKPPAVKPAELERFLEIFNFSMIPYSGKWMYVEPTEGHRDYRDLDAYVAWCEKHGIGLEFHFLNGYLPAWLRRRAPDEQGTRFLAHARDLAMRYGERIKYWQVVNEKNLIQYSPAVFAELRKLAPNAKLGISDCAKFFSSAPSPRREQEMLVGLREIRWLKEQGVKVDYFGFHGHRPFGVWFDPREMYEAMDAFAAEGVRLHLTELAVPLGGRVAGAGEMIWTPEMQADFYEFLFTVCFSHPAVDVINLWQLGPVGWQRGGGLLDENYNPKPAFHALKELIHNKWKTRVSGQLGLDGVATFRGFHGDYEIALKPPGGKTVRGTFAVSPESPNQIKLRFDREKKELTRAE